MRCSKCGSSIIRVYGRLDNDYVDVCEVCAERVIDMDVSSNGLSYNGLKTILTFGREMMDNPDPEIIVRVNGINAGRLPDFVDQIFEDYFDGNLYEICKFNGQYLSADIYVTKEFWVYYMDFKTIK